MRSSICALVALLVVGCTGTSDRHPTGAGAPGDGQVTQVDKADKAVYNPRVVDLVIDNPGGGLPGPQPIGDCIINAQSFTLIVADRSLAWSICGHQPATGARTLTADEWAEVEASLRTLVVAESDFCAPNATPAEVAVTTAEGTLTYGDTLAGCAQENQDRQLLDGNALAGVQGTLAKLAH
jgi:hypothetical protein